MPAKEGLVSCIVNGGSRSLRGSARGMWPEVPASRGEGRWRGRMNPLQRRPLLELQFGWVVVVKCSKVKAWVGGGMRRGDGALRMCDVG